ncbi:MAG TPA: DinB family protein [Gemmatimonadaceae bacterium]|nr:DinB family protein [Gemmatimonadaceae bacterium]
MAIVRELRTLQGEIDAYPDDESLWLTPAGISNSAGNLVLHLAGNLRHFVGSTLGGSRYTRNRDAEFATRGVSRAQLRAEVEATIKDVDEALSQLDTSGIDSVFPLAIGQPPRRVTTGDFLVHLAVHLAYHLGQIDYHRRLLTPSRPTVDALSITALPEPIVD